MIVRQENQVDPRQLVQVYRRIGPSLTRHAWPEVDVVAGVQEIGLSLALTRRLSW
jgi:glutamine phosphoribosylpyrophosphate amidotransferase